MLRPLTAAALAVLAAPALPAAQQRTAVAVPPGLDAARLDSVVRRVVELAAAERSAKGIPAFVVSLVAGGRTVWSGAVGEARPGVPATAGTIVRAGSITKLLTDVAVMRLVERKRVTLDLPVGRWLPELEGTPIGDSVTVRQLMAHRGGVVRESPAGSYFDSAGTGLAAMVASVRPLPLIAPPGARTLYSNVGVSILGRLLERVHGAPWNEVLRRELLGPLGMSSSGFRREEVGEELIARGRMWSLHGTSFDAPVFEMSGIGPAANLYATAPDLARFAEMLVARGAGPGLSRVVEAATLDSMWRIQYPGTGASERRGFGLGFVVGELDGRRTVGHNGAAYGFAAELLVLPDDSIAVAVVGTLDGVNAVTARIAREAARQLLALRGGRPFPTPAPAPARLDSATARRWAGVWRAPGATNGVELVARGDSLVGRWERGGSPFVLGALGDTLVSDDRLTNGVRLLRRGDALEVEGARLVRLRLPPPVEPSAAMRSVIGEYGWDYNVLYIYERLGVLRALVEWHHDYPLRRVNDTTWAFPAQGLYAADRIVFRRGRDGRVRQAIMARVPFPRRAIGPAEGNQLKIPVVRPIAELRAEALRATPPAPRGDERPGDLAELVALDSTIRLDVRYATRNNLFDAVFYSQPRAFLQRPAAEAVVRAHRKLRERGYGLLVHDGYRPWYVTWMFWEATPPRLREFVADPASGSRHNRGAAVDLTLYELATGRPVEMAGTYDETTERSYPDYPGGTSRQRWHRELLREAMEAEGFRVIGNEWWHFDYRGWREYPVLNVPFERLR